ADGEGEVRYAGEHHALVRHGFRKFDLAAVDGEPDAAEDQELESGGGDDDVGGEFGTGLQAQARLGEPGDVVGDHGDPALADRGEQVAVGDEAQSLVPRLVARLEMRVDVVAGGQLTDRRLAEHRLDDTGAAPAELVDQRTDEDVLPPDDRVRAA